MGGGYFATGKSKLEQSTVNIEAGKFFKIGWQGAGAVGLLIAGILLIALAFHTSQIL
jgi:hypothetical protein